MTTLVYAPGLRVTIGTARRGVIDVSDDVAAGSVRLGLGKDGGHRFNLKLLNDRRKYDGVFTPNDRIVIHLKRVKWLQVFSGYLDQVPLFTVATQDVRIAGQCTLKRLRYSLYDRGSQEVANFLNAKDPDVHESPDSDLGDKIIKVLQELATWDSKKVHMGGIPVDWFKEVNALYRQMKDQFVVPAMVGTTIGGASITNHGTATVNNQSGPGYGKIPTTTARVHPWSGGAFSLYAGGGTADPNWYCSMRWAYKVIVGDEPGLARSSSQTKLTAVEQRRAEAWWRARKLLVVNSKTQKAVVVRPVSWGPSNFSYDMELSAKAMSAIGAKKGDHLDVRFAEEHPVGPFTTPAVGPTAESTAGLTGGSAPASETGTTVSHEGLVFKDRENLAGNVAAARDFTLRSWTAIKTIGGYRATGSVATSDHPKGLALDIMVSSGEPTNDQVALGNSIAWWFIQNPGCFGTKYVIWNNMVYDARGARLYIRSDGGQSGVTLGHRDHVHVSFYDTNQTSIGGSGTPFPGITPGDFTTVAALGGVVPTGQRATAISGPGGVAGGGVSQLISAWNWYRQGDPTSYALAGPRMFLNDVPVGDLIAEMTSAAMRHYCSAPNGDFIAWFPDYFNLYGVLSRLVVQTIELKSFNIQWDDQHLITHSFVTGGSPGGQNAPAAHVAFEVRRALTHGIATVEFPELLSTLLNVNKSDPASAGWISPQAILKRFGARVKHEELSWATSREAEFWAAVSQFRLSWASQFSTSIELSFLPEAFPGTIMQIPEYGIQFYIDQVEHNFNLSPDGDGFTTTVKAIAPSTIGEQAGLFGLPRGGSWVGAQEQGPAYGPTLVPPGATSASGPIRPVRGQL